jgi:hypothetical protein
MGKAAAAAPADKVELYEKLVATNPSVKRKMLGGEFDKGWRA